MACEILLSNGTGDWIHVLVDGQTVWVPAGEMHWFGTTVQNVSTNGGPVSTVNVSGLTQATVCLSPEPFVGNSINRMVPFYYGASHGAILGLVCASLLVMKRFGRIIATTD